jgi:hypothetical protein
LPPLHPVRLLCDFIQLCLLAGLFLLCPLCACYQPPLADGRCGWLVFLGSSHLVCACSSPRRAPCALPQVWDLDSSYSVAASLEQHHSPCSLGVPASLALDPCDSDILQQTQPTAPDPTRHRTSYARDALPATRSVEGSIVPELNLWRLPDRTIAMPSGAGRSVGISAYHGLPSLLPEGG